MRIEVLNNAGGGFAESREVQDGLTVREFVEDTMGVSNVAEYKVRVNGEPARGDQVLFNGDRVTVAPITVKGARG